MGGQRSLDMSGVVLHPDDPSAQARLNMSRIGDALRELGGSLSDVVKLGVFYRNAPDIDAGSILTTISECLPASVRPAITAIPVPSLTYEGETLQIEAIASPSESSDRG